MAELKSVADYAAEYAGEPVVLPLGDGVTVQFPVVSFREFLRRRDEGTDETGVLLSLVRPEDRDALDAALEGLSIPATRKLASDVYDAMTGGNG